jgi:hypothetical protein
MSMSVNSTSNALSYIQTLLQSMSSGIGGATSADPLDNLSQLFAGSSADGSTNQTSTSTNAFGPSPPPFPNGTMAALIALQGQGANGAGGPQSLFSQLDTDGDGSISKSEFEGALSQSGVDTSSADALFAKLDQNGDGSVSQSELSSAAHRGHGHGHDGHHMEAGGSGGAQGGGDQGLSSLLNATGADGAQTQTATNADGSSTTTITYADGSTVTMTTPAAQQSDGTSGDGNNGQTAGGSGSNNLLEQLIKLQAQLISQQGASVSAVA